MRIHKTFGLILVVVIALLLTTGISGFRRSHQEDSRNGNRQVLDKTLWPIADYSSPSEIGPAREAKRKARGKKFDKSQFRVHPDDVSENTTIVDAIDPALPAFPGRQSTAVLIGSVVASQAFLSTDYTGVYSEFTVRVDEVLKTDSAELSAGCLTAVERRGGRVKFPSGRIHWYSVDKENMPASGRHYVFFLIRETPDEGYEILTAYELRGGKVFPLDDLSQFHVHEGKAEGEFMNALRIAIASD